jgi:L,D-peptidoglycan transpeptidase YkuD (ErfK/YbiS/YcfS/YnhG family)
MARLSRAAVLVTAVGSALAAALAVASAPSPGVAAEQTPLPERLANIGNSRQVVVVTTADWNTSHARLQTWRRSLAGEWTQVIAPIPARVGWSGVRRAENRKQSTGTTPAGTFGLLRGFGLARPSNLDLPYRRVDKNDWWPYDPTDPKTYNVLQPRRVKHAEWRPEWAERLKSYRSQYRYAVVLDYNLPSGVTWRNGERVASATADTTAGGGIFLHVNGTGATAGCVSISRDRMRQVLKWLDPAKDPVIVIGPRDIIDRM